MANTLITLKNASLAFGDYPLLDNTDFSVHCFYRKNGFFRHYHPI